MHQMVDMYGLQCSTDGYEEITKDITESVDLGAKRIFIHVNLHNLTVLLRDDRRLKFITCFANYYFEGIGLKLLACVQGKGWLRDTNGTDLFPKLANVLNREQKSVYLLGATDCVLDGAVRKIEDHFPNICIVGRNNGYFSDEESGVVVERINSARPDILILGMGMEKEASFIAANYHKICAGSVWCTGGLLDFVSGAKPRAPKYIRSLRLEWLYRLSLDPKSKYRRVFVSPFRLMFHDLTNRTNSISQEKNK